MIKIGPPLFCTTHPFTLSPKVICFTMPFNRPDTPKVPLPIGASTTTTVLRPFFGDHPGEPVPEENFWTLW